ncbi:DUF4252 domain-containing protein [uncultured Maribacter sp.]|uniref:DUF4252 domain-containing protein n=1 Tax=uncultured Maribacter sp. TaxID=431308 RepID=UPI00260882F0|nr:DUF4252 domain-containing protein [uncultured Maribacter sp.]
MIKNILFSLSMLFIASCSSYNSIDTFYNAHKNDNHVTAVRVPNFMLSLISNISPEMNSLIGNTRDLRYMQFPSKTAKKTTFLNKQMNSITGNSFIEVYRKNENLKRNIVSIREKKNTVKEILIYNNNNEKGSFLYFNGNFDPVKVREMAKNNQFENLGNNLINQINYSTPRIKQEQQ